MTRNSFQGLCDGYDEAYADFPSVCYSDPNYRCVFGHPAYSNVIDNTFGRKIEQAWFAPGSLFCLDLWDSTPKGKTKRWQTFVLKAGQPGDLLTTLRFCCKNL
jgi:hypothetical protein